MDFNYNDLMPWAAGISIGHAAYRLPLTPFFMNPAGSAKLRTLGFHGDDFHLQYKNTLKFGEDGTMTDKPICGTAAFRTFTSVDLDTNASVKWNGSRTSSYHFDTDAKTIVIRTVQEGRPAIGLTHSRTASTAKQGDAFNEPPTHVEVTLSEPVDKAWLLAELQRWGAESEKFRDATGSGLGTYSFGGHGATKSESDGYLGMVGGGDVVALGFTFAGAPSGMSGDEGEFWNGNFATWIERVVRKNAPVIHRESSPNYLSLSKDLSVGSSIYRQGYTEIEASEPLGEVWMDEYGVFLASKALDELPMMAAEGYELGSLVSYTGEGGANELRLISRTGKRYRVKVETGHYAYGTNSPSWVSSRSYILLTDPISYMATLTFESPDEDAWMVRVAKIDEEVEATGGWNTVADVAQGDYPEALIGSNVAGDFLLLAAIKRPKVAIAASVRASHGCP
ncbi:hypothetical protein EON80_08460 [bacterium]|nr:MAG: hypothetical protein EON80_08460 [bacterium]